MRLRRPALYVLASVTLHGLAVWLSAREADAPPSVPVTRRPSKEVELEVRYVDPAPTPRPAPEPPGARAKAPQPSRRSTSAAQKPPTGTTDEGDAPASGGEASAGPTALHPSGSWVLGLPTLNGPDGRTAQATPGKTRHPGDSDSTQALTVERERVRSFVQGFAEGQLSAIKVRDGNFHPYFVELKNALAEAAKNPPPFKAPNLVQGFVRDWAEGASAFGASGNPWGDDPRARRPDDAVNPITLARERSGFVDPTATMVAQSRAVRRALGEGAPPALIAIVELYQGPDGALRRVEISHGSGVPAFDKHVLTSAPKSLQALASPPSEASPKIARGEELHTTWAFEGRVVYKRHLRDMSLKDDALYLAAALPLNLLTGNFEETTGDVQIIDVRQPSYACAVRLLAIH